MFRCTGADHNQLYKATYDHEGDETYDECDPNLIVSRPARSDSTPKIHYGNIWQRGDKAWHHQGRDI